MPSLPLLRKARPIRRPAPTRPVLEALEGRILLADIRVAGASVAAAVHVAKASRLRPTPLTATPPGLPDAAGLVTVAGKTLGRAKVALDIGADGTVEQRVRADRAGRYRLAFA